MPCRAVATYAVLVVALSAPAIAQPAATARVAGFVAGPGGAPIDAALVTLVLLDGDGETVRQWTTHSAADGAFQFETLAGGRYRLSAERAGYTDLAIDPSADLRRETHEIELADGGALDGIRLVLRRAGSIAGRIVRPDGAPAADAEVMAGLRASPDAPLRIVTRTTSAFDGRYELAGLPPGAFVVAARPHPDSFFGHDEASRAAVTAVTRHPGVPESSGGAPVPVFEAMPTEGIDVWLLPAPLRFTLTGRVFDSEGRRLRDIAIEYSDVAGIRRGVWLVTDPDGYFAIQGLPPGTLLMLARAESEDGPRAGTAATTLAVDGAEDVRLVMGPPGRVEGRLVADGGGALPYASIRVSLVHTRIAVSILYPAAEAAPDAAGRFELPRAFGTYRVEVSGLPDGWRVIRLLRAGRAVADGQITVAHEERVGEIEIVVGP
jgi:hypothetical protein